jgi:hypothetical protein
MWYFIAIPIISHVLPLNFKIFVNLCSLSCNSWGNSELFVFLHAKRAYALKLISMKHSACLNLQEKWHNVSRIREPTT